MTLPDERTRAVLHTEQFLHSLLDPKLTPRVPRDVRKQALRCLRHYPAAYYIETAARFVPDIFGSLRDA